MIFGRLDCSSRVLEARPKSSRTLRFEFGTGLSIYLVAAVTESRRRDIGKCIFLVVLCFTVQCILLVSITCEFIEGPATIVAPGFQPHVNDGTLRRKWARHVAADAAAAALLSLIVWIMWVKFNGLRVYRIYWEGRRVRRWVLVFAMLAKVTLIFCSCFITYMLFRGDNALLSMILNVMKIQYVNRLDTEVVRIGREAPRLGCVIGDAEDLTASVARDLRKRDLSAPRVVRSLAAPRRSPRSRRRARGA